MTGGGRGRALDAQGLRLLELLSMPEVAVMLPGRHSVRYVRRLADAGELELVKLGRAVRITPESVAAYRQRLRAELAEQAYDQALTRLKAAIARASTTLRNLRRGQITPEEYERFKACIRKATAEVSAARKLLRQENERLRDQARAS